MSALAAQTAVGIRDMQAEDLLAVVEIENRAYAFPWDEETFNICLCVGYDCSVIEVDGRLIGYGIISFRGKVCHVLNLCIDTAFQCRGYGSMLLDGLFEKARCSGADRVVLEVRFSNTAALNMYRKKGFEEVGVCPGYYPSFGKREDALMLMRMLDTPVPSLALSA